MDWEGKPDGQLEFLLRKHGYISARSAATSTPAYFHDLRVPQSGMTTHQERGRAGF
jgi:hypothetical protein